MQFFRFIQSLSHVLLPNLCCACDRALRADEHILCMDCLFHLPITDFHQDQSNESAKQLWGKLDFEYAFSMLYLQKSSRVEQLLHRLKFKGYPEIGLYLGTLYASTLARIHLQNPIDYIIPIPLHRQKLRKRGYNQAECFAKGLSTGLSVPLLTDVLLRIVASASQTTMARVERYNNVEQVFALSQKETCLEGKHILLVDDVLTTGATICAAGNMLKKRGARVSIATIARA